MDFDCLASPNARPLPQRGQRRHPISVGLNPDGRVDLEVDFFRHVVFPNRVRQQRILRGFPKLFSFCAKLEGIPYIRISKIERGEVFARADELRAIADALALLPTDLLLDVEAEDFDIEAWVSPFAEGSLIDTAEESAFAMFLAAAVRARRNSDRNLTAATMARDYDISPVILSRLENAHKALGRWNDQIVGNLCRLFGVGTEAELRALVIEQHQNGELDRFLADLPNAQSREARTRDRVAELMRELDRPRLPEFHTPLVTRTTAQTNRLLPVFGSPLPDGLIAMTPTGLQVEALAAVGSRAFGVRIGRASLGGGLPGHATVIVDPDRFPQAGGLALVKEGRGYRLLSVVIDKNGLTIGYSVAPSREVPLDGLGPEDISSVVAAIFI